MTTNHRLRDLRSSGDRVLAQLREYTDRTQAVFAELPSPAEESSSERRVGRERIVLDRSPLATKATGAAGRGQRRRPRRRTAPRPPLEFPELDGLVGMHRLVEHLRSFSALIWHQRHGGSRTAAQPRLPHLVFSGPPGTGKTTVAKAIGKALRRMGALDEGHVVVASRGDLVGHYIGETAPKVDAAVDRALGGVLFVDEAYGLVPSDSGRDYGHEAVATLLQRLENDRGRFLCIVAGYHREMEAFLDVNPGLRSRFSVTIPFEDYDLEDLVEIARGQARELSVRLSAAAAERLPAHLVALRARPGWANARSTRSLIEAAHCHLARRLLGEGGDPTSEYGRTIQAEDLPPVEPVPGSESPARCAPPSPPRATAVESSTSPPEPVQARIAAALERLAWSSEQPLLAQPRSLHRPHRRSRRRVPAWISAQIGLLGLEAAVLLAWLSSDPEAARRLAELLP